MRFLPGYFVFSFTGISSRAQHSFTVE